LGRYYKTFIICHLYLARTFIPDEYFHPNIMFVCNKEPF
jgi:hypothetical protein